MPVQIRDARPEDAEAICGFNYLMALETENKRLDRETLSRGVRQALERLDLCRYFVAEDDADVVGQCMITYEWSDWRAGTLWWFQSVYVERSNRRRGVFRALYSHVQALARSQPDVCGLRLYVEQENQRARETYCRLGMRPSGHVVYELDWSGTGQQRLAEGEKQ